MGISIQNKKKRELNSNAIFVKKAKFNDKSKEYFYREWALLLKSGVDVKKALDILIKQWSNQKEKLILIDIKNNIEKGKSIAETFKETNLFSSYEYFSIQIGEETRKLEEILTELQNYFSKKIAMKRQLISVLTYPALVLIVTVGVLYFMLSKVVPMFSSVFKQFDSELPKSTQLILQVSKHTDFILYTFLGTIALIAIYHNTQKNKNSFRKFWSKIILKTPFFGELTRKIYISRMCQALKLLLTSKATLTRSLNLTKQMINFYPLETALEHVKNDIIKGKTLHESLTKHAVFDTKMTSMIEVAEQINQLDDMFEKLSKQYNEEIEYKTKMIGVILEPMIIIIIGIIVGGIMIAMYAPMFDLSKIIN